ncbi:hypothetical protein BWQ92_15345 [Arthrobacter sp. QXT-31]|nr:hypothetical protein BWQ92_15345 [Arthrobacter sp. QXT-31]
MPKRLGNGTTDATSGVQAVIDSAASFGAQVYFPDGVYKVTSPLENFHNVHLSKGAIITAGAPGMAAVVRTQLSKRYDNGAIVGGGTIDANTNAAIGIHVRNFLYFKLNNLTVHGGNAAGIKLGDSRAIGRAAEAILSNIRIINNGSVITGSRGILSENSGDHSFAQVLVMNYEYGVTLPVGNNAMLEDVHVWAEPSKGATKIGFEDFSNSSHYSKCHADAPIEYGFRLYGYQTTLVQCGTYLNPNVPQVVDNTVVGVKFEAAYPIGTLVGHYFFGGSGAKRLKSDIEAADGNYGLIQHFGCSSHNVVTLRSLYNRSIGMTVRDRVLSTEGFEADSPTPLGNLGLSIKTNTLDRWKIVSDGGAETGSNTGTGLAIRRYDDNGALLSEPIFISRSSGTIVLKNTMSLSDGVNLVTGSTTGTQFSTSPAQKIGFYGLAPVAQQAVAGPRGSAAAQASLTAKLANLGLVTDTTVSPISTKTTSQTITAADRYVISDGGTLIQTLPDPTLASVGYPVTIKNVNVSSCTVRSLGGGLIDGAASKTLPQWATVTFITDGTQWLTV